MSDPSKKLLENYRDSLDNTTDNSFDVGPETDFEKEGFQRQTSTHAKTQKWLLYAVTVFLLGAVFYTLGLYTHIATSPSPVPESHTFGTCGNDTASALQNGCILDLMSEAWVHPDCYDQELETEFLSLSDWHWYADQAGDHELTIEEIRATGGPDPMWVNNEYHEQHCKYTWMKLHRAVVMGRPIDNHIGRYEHTIHCSDALIRPKWIPKMKGSSAFNTLFTTCYLPESFNLVNPIDGVVE